MTALPGCLLPLPAALAFADVTAVVESGRFLDRASLAADRFATGQ